MNERYLIDTNILVYIYDRSEPKKQKQALQLLDSLVESREGTLSTQVLSEFFSATTRKLAAPLSPTHATERVEHFIHTWPILQVTPLVILEACRIVQAQHISFYDAQIWATAKLNQIPYILSEDFQEKHPIEGIQFVNPFKKDFVLP